MPWTQRLYELALTGSLLASLAVNAALSVAVLHLRTAARELNAGERLRVGTTLPEMSAFTVSGAPVTMNFRSGGLPTVLYVFSPTCRWCARNMPNLKALQKGAAGKYRLVGVSLSPVGLNEYSAAHGLEFPILTKVDPKFVSRCHLGGTPQTIVVSAASRVLQSWMGAYDDDTKAQVERALGVPLPGTRMSAAP